MKTLLIILLIAVPLFFMYQHGEGYFFTIYSQAKEMLSQGLIAILLCLWLMKKNFKFNLDPLTWPIITFLAIVCLSALWA